MRKREPTIHEALAAIDQRIVQARQAGREAELAYRRGQEAIAQADQAHLDAQARMVAGQPSDVEAAAEALQQAKQEALPARELEIANRAVELANQERTAFLASHVAEFERHFSEQYGEARRKVEESEAAIVAADALWQETNRRHFSFRQVIGYPTDDIPQTPLALRDSSRASRQARESGAAA
jgi:hypothetical protein